jgi:hypothetical protein
MLTEVVADLLDGVIAANRLHGAEAEAERRALLAALDPCPSARAA